MPFRFARLRPTNNANNRRRGPLVLIAGVLIPALAVAGAAAAQDQPTELEPITVDSTRLERDWVRTPAALGVVDTEAAQLARQHLQLDESLSRIPGVFLQNRYNFAQDLRISIRGFGARSPFGIRGVKLIVDGIPVTTVDGQSQTDTIDLTSIEQIEVIRGPSSALYGNATGGVIDIETYDPPEFGLLRLRADVGSDGYYRQSVQGGEQFQDWGYFLSVQNLEYDGFREFNQADNQLLNGKLNLRLFGDATLHAVLRVLHAPDTQDPGALDRAAVSADRSQARAKNILFDSHQDVDHQTLGLVLDNPLGDGQTISARAFYTHRDFAQFLPIDAGVITYDRAFYGAGLQYIRSGQLFSLPSQFTVGIDAQVQDDDRQRFDNLMGDIGPLAFDQNEQARVFAVYLQNILTLTERLELTLGLRYDDIKFEIDDNFIVPDGGDADMLPDDPDDSGERSFTEPSGTIALSYAFAPNQRVYATVGTAFQTPTFTEFADPDGTGGFNPAIAPQEAVNYEIGARGYAGIDLRYSLALFMVQVEDELVVFESPGGRDFFQNSGESERLGLETQLAYRFNNRLNATVAFTYSDFEFEEFVDKNGNDFSGKRIPGIPESQFFGELAYRVPGGYFAIVDVQFFDELYADNANTVKIDGYGVVGARLGIEERLWRQPLTVYFGVNNLLDEEYFANVRINAFGGRYFEPAPGRTIYLGAELEI